MKSVAIVDINGKSQGKFNLDEAYFTSKVNNSLLHQTSVAYLKNQRVGCASTKTRANVRGGGKKPWRQKGTGRARVGSIRNPIWRGGGVVFGPHPRDYRNDLPKSIKNLSLVQSLNAKIKSEDIIIVDAFSLSAPKTKEFVAILKNLKVEDKSLVVIEKNSPDIFKAARNIPGITLKVFNNINSWDVLKHKKVIFSKQALENLVKMRKR